MNRRAGGVDSARAAIETEDRAALLDSLILCKFLRGVFVDFNAETAAMLRAVTGWDLHAEELQKVARRVVNARKCLNEREGWTRDEDTLPARFLTDVDEREGNSPSLSRARLSTMIAAYYERRGWDAQGRVPIELRRELGLDGSECDVARSSARPLTILWWVFERQADKIG